MEFDWSAVFEVIFRVISLLVMLFSLAGLVIPIFPGIVVIWLVALVTMLVTGIGGWGWVLLAFLTVLMVVGTLADNLTMAAVVRDRGASWTAIALGLLAGLIGTILLPPFGGLLAAPGVLYLVESRRLGDRQQAWEVVKAMVLGWGWGVVARLGIGVVMVVLWGIWALTAG